MLRLSGPRDDGPKGGGPVDDMGGNLISGRLASADKRLSKQTTKTNALRSSIRRLKKQSGDQLINPWEAYGKPATFMPSMKRSSFAIQRAKDGDPSALAQIIGRNPYPSEIRNLDALMSDYQDFAGGVRAKATEITKTRKTAAQEAADAEELAGVTRYASLSRQLLGESIRGAKDEFLDLASDEIGALWNTDPASGRDMLNKFIKMGNDERTRYIKAEKGRRAIESKGGSLGAGYYASFTPVQLEGKISHYEREVATRAAKVGAAGDLSDEPMLLNQTELLNDGTLAVKKGAPAWVASRVAGINEQIKVAKEGKKSAEVSLSRFTGELARRTSVWGDPRDIPGVANKILAQPGMKDLFKKDPAAAKAKLAQRRLPPAAIALAHKMADPDAETTTAPTPTGQTGEDDLDARGGEPETKPDAATVATGDSYRGAGLKDRVMMTREQREAGKVAVRKEERAEELSARGKKIKLDSAKISAEIDALKVRVRSAAAAAADLPYGGERSRRLMSSSQTLQNIGSKLGGKVSKLRLLEAAGATGVKGGGWKRLQERLDDLIASSVALSED